MKNKQIKIDCPSCNHTFDLEDAYSLQVEEQMKEALNAKEKELRKILEKESKQKLAVEMKDLEEQLNEKSGMLEAAHKQELESRKKLRAAADKEKNLEIEIQRRVDENNKKLKKESAEDFENQKKLIKKEHSTVVESLKTKVEELTKKLAQGSQQSQGEILELVLEEDLQALFPTDNITPVPKGVSGADVIQTVNNSVAQVAGTIVWEFKNTKTWSDTWIQKLKDDQRALKGDIAVILSATLPKTVKGFSYYQGVWVCDIKSYAGLSTALRQQLLQIHSIRQAGVGKNQKMEYLYRYLSGNEFKQRVETIIEAFSSMKDQLNKEKIAMNKMWSKREKELERVLLGTTGMYGDLEGIVGNSLAQIEGLELEALPGIED